MNDHLLKDDIDPCASLMFVGGGVVQSLTTKLTILNLGNLSRLYRTCICGQCAILFLSLAVGSRLGRGLVFAGLGGRLAGVAVILFGLFLHEYGNQELKEHDHSLKQGADFWCDFALIREVLIFVLKLVELLPEGLLVDAGHSELYRLLGFDSHYGGKYGETL